MTLKSRLRFDADHGAILDANRRYLLMRPDVLMGAVRVLSPTARAEFLDALVLSARTYVASSLTSYAVQSAGDANALIQSTLDAARDLGWGVWQLHGASNRQWLRVRNSPFAQAYGACDVAVCAPITGVFAALMSVVLATPVTAQEAGCVASGHEYCEFEIIQA